MKVELERKDLEALVKGKPPYYNQFNNPLVIKAGHRYSDQYGRTNWDSLSELTDEEMYKLYVICKNSWDYT